jgi:hypothetical protein
LRWCITAASARPVENALRNARLEMDARLVRTGMSPRIVELQRLAALLSVFKDV